MSQSPFRPAFNGDNNSTPTTMSSGVYHHNWSVSNEGYPYISGSYALAAPLNHAHPGSESYAAQDSLTWRNNFYSEMSQPVYHHDDTGGRVFPEAELQGLNGVLPAGLGHINHNIGMSSDTSVIPLSNGGSPNWHLYNTYDDFSNNSPPDFSDTNPPAMSGYLDLAPTINGRSHSTPFTDFHPLYANHMDAGHNFGIGDHIPPTDLVDSDGDDVEYPALPSHDSTQKKGKKSGNRKKKNPDNKANKIKAPVTSTKDKAPKKSAQAALEEAEFEEIALETDIDSDDNIDTEPITEKRIKIPEDLVLEAKIRKAKDAIEKQKRNSDPAKQIGQHINIVYSATGVSVLGRYWESPKNDNTIPSTPDEINACIDRIAKAMRNNKDCRENPKTKQFRNRWGEKAVHYLPHEIDAAARDLLFKMINIHQYGWTQPIFDKDQRELFQKTMHFKFQERLDGVVELLTHSKTNCAYLMKGERCYSIIGNPGVLTMRTASNKVSNKTKAKRIIKGTEVEKIEASNTEESMPAALQETLPKGKGKKRARDEHETDTETTKDVSKRSVKRARKSRSRA